ncbi:MAG: threonine ammonia-lyase [Betaproteobacteria bacterium]|jgi:threonine dehydratase|nr:MAG: threonine ammonia-lyase [Betaproteobacteria bacterium]
MSVGLKDIRAAAQAIAGDILQTPCLRSRTLSDIVGAQLYLKFENQQFTSSFKERGALNRLRALDADARKRGVIAVSAGNHAQGVAYHAQRLGVPTVIVMPRFTPHVKVVHTRNFGAEVLLHGENFDAAKEYATGLIRERGLTFIHPYDDVAVIAGQGTVALEMLDAWPDLEVLVVPIGGGGLISGMAVAAKAINPAIQVVGVETLRFPSMYCALRGTTPHFGEHTIADGIAVKVPGALTVELVRHLVDEIVLVDEGDIEEAMLLLLEVEKTVVEGAGAVALAAALKHPERVAGKKLGLVLCGGNIDPLTLADVIKRGMARAGRLTRLRVQMHDLPGSLAQVTRVLGEANANIDEVHHHRAFTTLPVHSAQVEFAVRTMGSEHIQQIVDALAQAGFPASIRNAEN